MKTLFCALVLALSLLRGAATDDQAWKTLTDGIADEHADKRMHAVAAFVLLKPSARTVSLVEGVLEDKDVLVRQTAVETLGALKSRASIPKLKPLLEDESPEVSFTAARVLWDLGDRSGRDILEAVMARERKSTPGVVAGSMRDAKSKLHNPAYLALLGAKTGAGIAFGPVGFGFTMMEALMKDSGATARALSATLLAQDKTHGSAEYIEDALEDKNWAVRVAVVRALAESGRKAAIPKLEPVLEDKRDEVRYMAAAAIVRLSDRRVTAPKVAPRVPKSAPTETKPAAVAK